MALQWKRYFRLKRLRRCLSSLLFDPKFSVVPEFDQKPRLLLIKTEAIGDYILFRNFLKEIRQSEKYKDYHITLVGNEIWKPLFEKLDFSFVNEAIFLNRNLFQLDSAYRKKQLTLIGNKYFKEVVNCTYSREFLLGDSIVRAVSAGKKTGMFGDAASEIPFVKWLGDTFYTSLYRDQTFFVFEFQRNKQFFESLLGFEINLTSPTIDSYCVQTNNAILLPGAQDNSRKWPAKNFQEVAYFLNQNYGFEVIVAGSEMDFEIAKEVIGDNPKSFIKNECGKSSLADLPELLGSARIVICNDSGTLHVSAAVNTPTICISNGNHYGRFTPYPSIINKDLIFLYPNRFLQKNKNEEDRVRDVEFGSSYSIAEIDVKTVIESIQKLMHA